MQNKPTLILLLFIIISLNSCKKEKVEHPLPKWFLKRSWSMVSLKLNGTEVPDTMTKYFNEYKFQFNEFCDPLNRCYYTCSYFKKDWAFIDDLNSRPSIELFEDGVISGYRFCYIAPYEYFPYPIPSLKSLKITSINKEEMRLISNVQTPEVYEVVFRSKVE